NHRVQLAERRNPPAYGLVELRERGRHLSGGAPRLPRSSRMSTGSGRRALRSVQGLMSPRDSGVGREAPRIDALEIESPIPTELECRNLRSAQQAIDSGLIDLKVGGHILHGEEILFPRLACHRRASNDAATNNQEVVQDARFRIRAFIGLISL